jgi:CheY-like chemotaxis protein
MTGETLKGIKILIVEDDMSSRLYLNKILEKTGALILNAGNGKDAVDIASSEPGLRVILMDIQLPLMDGYTATAKIRGMGIDVKIIAQTAYSLTGDMESLMAAGFDDYIIKPIFSGQLIEKLTEHLASDS